MNIQNSLSEKSQSSAFCDRLNVAVERDENKLNELRSQIREIRYELEDVNAQAHDKQQSIFQTMQEIANIVGPFISPMSRAARLAEEAASALLRIALGRQLNELETDAERLNARAKNLEHALADTIRKADNRERLLHQTQRDMIEHDCPRTNF